MISCRNCQHSRHDSSNLICPFKDTPANDEYQGVCSRASNSYSENARFDRRCADLAQRCFRYTKPPYTEIRKWD